ncbi:MAG TPA: hypothetical protein VFB54_20770 [Burkholderiales bacterium]|nr:hypothetical protein [Burkholderiales bacterium]
MIRAGHVDEGVQRLAAVLRQVAARADELIEAVRKDGGDRYQASVRRLEKQLRRTQADLEELEHSMLHGTRSALRSVNRAAMDHPYATASAGLVMGAALGLVAGLMLTRR